MLYWFSSIASLSSPFSDGINGAVVDVSYHINSTLAGRVASIDVCDETPPAIHAT